MSTSLPNFENYGHYSSDNYGVNSLKFIMPNITIWFSYKTPVAFCTVKTGRVVRKNDWNTTTGKHLNWIDGNNKKARIDGDIFESMLKKALL